MNSFVIFVTFVVKNAPSLFTTESTESTEMDA